ncbi:uncharacterized protein LOC135215936 [Macrobrachium nipponense]|uniref:uncharacterized protein LOC135215936 n=1 Tax=Macrobrachium nipponense TaxID=159736 RepID=UPI0030C7FF0D
MQVQLVMVLQHILFFTMETNQVQSNLVMGKSRVSPKKLVTIPRLELTAATVSVKVAQHILKELEFTVGKVVYYTDSTTVLHYIHSNTKRFPVFVANRVRVIRDYSQPEQWKYVNSSDNPADVASRGISVHQFLQYDEWFHGPSFIASDYLPSQEYVCADCVDGKSEHVSAVTISEEHHGFTRLIEYFSSWSRLQKAVSVFQQLKSILSGKRKGCVTTDAERAIIMYVQQEVFGDEVKALSRELSVGKSSPIYKLDPFLDSEDGLLKEVERPALSQKMADLPADRLEPSPPFSNVGIDLFGPYYIKEGRKELKRFVSRRGHPKVIRCDNGTNFHGAERELKAALDEMEEKKIEKYLSHHHIEGKFNPPAASHMGGCWERQIRTVRKVMSALVKEFGGRTK